MLGLSLSEIIKWVLASPRLPRLDIAQQLRQLVQLGLAGSFNLSMKLDLVLWLPLLALLYIDLNNDSHMHGNTEVFPCICVY